MSQIALEVLKYGEQLETLLAAELGATGKGLGEKLISVEHKLSRDLVQEIKFRIVPERNEAAHHPSTYSLLNPEAFLRSCEKAVADLKDEIAKIKSPPPSFASEQPSFAQGRQLLPQQRGLSTAMVAALMVIAVVVGVLLGRSVFSSHVRLIPKPYPLITNAEPPPESTVVSRVQTHLPPPPATAAVTVAARRRAAPSVLKTVKHELHVSAVQNALVTMSGMRLRWSEGGFGDKRLVIDATVTNQWSKYLASLDTEAKVYVSQDKRWITGIDQHVFFSSDGLAPGRSTKVQIRLGGTFGDYAIQVPDVVNARKLTAVLRIRSATDGIGDDVNPNGAVISAE